MGDRCRSCGAEILWARTFPGGHNLPLDPEPDPERGNTRRVGNGFSGLRVEVLQLREVGVPDLEGEPRYLTHFATCPDSKEWSGSKRG